MHKKNINNYNYNNYLNVIMHTCITLYIMIQCHVIKNFDNYNNNFYNYLPVCIKFNYINYIYVYNNIIHNLYPCI